MIPLGVLGSFVRAAAGDDGGDISFIAGAVSTPVVHSVEHTFTGVSFGEEAANRTLFAAIATRVASGRQITGVTIGGVAAHIDINTTPSWPSALIARAVVPEGTSGDIVVTYGTSEAGPLILGLYSAYGVFARVNANKHYSGATTTSSASLAHGAGASMIAAVGNSHTAAVTHEWDPPFTADYARNRTDNGNGSAPAGSFTHANGLAAGPTSVRVVSSSALYQGLAAAAYEPLPANALSYNRFDCKVPATLSAHVAAGHTNYGPPLASSHDGNTRVGDGTQADTLWSDSHGIYGLRVLADVGQSTNLKISTRMVGRVLSGTTAGDRHYGIALGCPSPASADGVGGLSYFLTHNGILTGGLITAGWSAQTGILVSGIPMSNDMEMSVELDGLDVTVTVDGNVVYTTTLPRPTVGTYAGAHVHRVQWNALIGYKWIKVEAL